MIQYDLAEDIDLRFDQRTGEDQTKILIHEVLDIPHSLTILTISRH
jgi:predicted metallopeptidase